MEIQHFFDPQTSTLSYVVYDLASRVAVVIDPVADYEPAGAAVGTASAQRVADFLDAHQLEVPYVMDTHAHADHLSALPFFRDRYDACSVIGSEITQVQSVFRQLFDLGPGFPVDGSQFDHLIKDGERLEAGPLRIEALHTPGHTPACMSYLVTDGSGPGALFVGDVLFQPDYGTARCDFPAGSADALFDSVQHLYRLPPETRVFTGHDYQPGGRELRFESTIAEQREENVQLRADTPRDQFVAFREQRDAGLSPPALILPAIQVNIRAGDLPEPAANGRRYLKLPIDAFGGSQ